LLLRTADTRLGPTFAVHCALGMLSAAESDWGTALGEFQCAQAVRECPEAHYLVGLAQYNMGNFRAARAVLKKAVKLDSKYAAAQYLLGLAHLSLDEGGRATRAFEAAAAADPRARQYREALRPRARASKLAPPNLGRGAGGRRGLLTGGDPRLAALLYADALGQAARR
jgi:tetratricopeptide (TPR) repeat protein